jgi:formylglycine-generating enzyme required for sulfatase activity
MKNLKIFINMFIVLFFSFLIQVINCQSPKEDIHLNNDSPVRTYPLRVNGITRDFVRVPEGEFMMGSDERQDEQPVHTVSIKSFDMSATEITVEQFRAFIQATGYITDAETVGSSYMCCWRPKLGITWRNPGFSQSDNEPVTAVSWNDAIAYCLWLSAETGDEYRLPSEAEWEYAARAGEMSGKTFHPDSVAWYNKNSEGRTHPVGTKRCNKWGLYDMIGNAWEWTGDIYHDSYAGAPSDGSSWTEGGSFAQGGYLKPGEGRVLRGGAWGLSYNMHPVSYDLRVTSRPVFGKDNSCNNSGFRIVRSIMVNQNITAITRLGCFMAGGIDYNIVWMPEGNFVIGDDNGGREIRPAHVVYFEHPYAIGKTEVTVRQFRSFVKSAGYLTEAEKSGKCWDSDFRSRHTSIRQPGFSWKNPGFEQSENDPVTCITWNDAMAFCRWLSKETGRYIRLPSEAEWEYALSAGDQKFDKDVLSEIAWYYDNSEMRTHPTGGKIPNVNGIFDMLGNVSEWTMDLWHPDFSGAPVDGSSWLGLPVTARVIKGGSFEREASEMGPHGRDWYEESEAVVGTGFRIVDTGIAYGN